MTHETRPLASVGGLGPRKRSLPTQDRPRGVPESSGLRRSHDLENYLDAGPGRQLRCGPPTAFTDCRRLCVSHREGGYVSNPDFLLLSCRGSVGQTTQHQPASDTFFEV